MATMNFNCSQCNQVLMIDDSAAGTQVQCPSCGTALRVPSAQPAGVTAAAGAAVTVNVGGAEPAPYYRAVLSIFFTSALLIFFLPFVKAGTAVAPQSPFDVVLQLTNKSPDGQYRSLKEVLMNGGDLARVAADNSKSMKAMLGVVLLWITSLGFIGFCVLTMICAFIYFGSGNIPGVLLKIALICGMQFVPMCIIGDSLIKSGALDGAAAAVGGLLGGGGAGHIGVYPAWGAWLLAILCLVVFSWESIAKCCFKKAV
jgi:ribosomal protein S27E